MTRPNKPIRAYDEFTTNIKGLPEGEYVTQTMYSDAHPFVVVSRTAQTITVLPVRTKLDPDWKPNILPGGFCGHCTNQETQTYIYDGVDHDAKLTVLRLKKSRYYGSDKLWNSPKLGEFCANGADRFHDYNF